MQQMQYNAPNRTCDFQKFSGGESPEPPFGAISILDKAALKFKYCLHFKTFILKIKVTIFLF